MGANLLVEPDGTELIFFVDDHNPCNLDIAASCFYIFGCKSFNYSKFEIWWDLLL